MRIRAIRAGLAVAAIALATPEARGQLRPLDQTEWRLFSDSATISARTGVSKLFEQRASLAGTTGDLWEIGSFTLAWRTGRVILEAAGTAQRFFREDGRFAAAYPDVDPSDDGHRHDSGAYHIATAVRLTPDSWPVAGAVRFGTRLPTTDNKTGLDRDAVDFFATLGASSLSGLLALSGEAGLGINTTREPRFEQDDLFLYSVKGELRFKTIVPSIEVLGQLHGPTHREIRGVEDLGEVRVGVRAGQRRWIRIEAVKGHETFSPSAGVIVTAGFLR